MGQLTSTMIAQIANFRQSIMDALTTDLNEGQAVDAISAAGACSLTRELTELTVGSTLAFTLAAPTYVTQRKRIRCVATSGTPAGTLTITGPDDTTGFVCPATFFFDVSGQEIWLEATSALKWRCIKTIRAGGSADNVVVGTTAITNKLWARYCASATGAVNSTLPNGSSVGERIQIICSTAGLGAAGVFDGTYTGGAAVAYTHLGAIGVAASTTVSGDTALLEWNGLAWNVVFQTGCTLS